MAELEFEGFESEQSNPAAFFAALAIVIAVVFSVVFYVVGATRKSKLATLERRVDDLKKQMAVYGDLEGHAQGLTKAVKSFDEIILTQVNWRDFWQMVAQSQIKGVYYTAATVDAKGVVKADGVAPSYETLGKQVKSLETTPGFSQVIVSQTSKEDSKIRFSLNFNFDKNKLKVAK